MVAQGQVVDEAPESGFYQAPTLLRDVPVTHRLAQEEVFGPVLAPWPSRTRTMRWNSPTPRSSAWWPASGRATARASCAWRASVKSGQVFINNYGAGGGVELPFGGVKSSGYGREKGFEALYGFTTLKTVAIKHG
jgi:aldehyde dehydrogenase (NAD+)